MPIRLVVHCFVSAIPVVGPSAKCLLLFDKKSRWMKRKFHQDLKKEVDHAPHVRSSPIFFPRNSLH